MAKHYLFDIEGHTPLLLEIAFPALPGFGQTSILIEFRHCPEKHKVK